MIQEQTYSQVIENMNRLQFEGRDYFFMINYEKTFGLCLPLSEISTDLLKFDISNNKPSGKPPNFTFDASPINFNTYEKDFLFIQNEIQKGNTYLCNLTYSTPIKCSLSLTEMFKCIQAKYKLIYLDEFLVFSPESFIHIAKNTISTYPMKGTINADLKDAYKQLINDPKELAENNTIVDLLRNDLSIISNDVRVKKFQYIEEVKTHKGSLLQMSSEINGSIKPRYQNEYGTLIDLITPAGSISGAPKKKTLDIIHQIEKHQRNYYTGIFGVWQDQILDTAVMIRFIENTANGMVFKSGGGIHSLSAAYKEYDELISKVYVPIY